MSSIPAPEHKYPDFEAWLTKQFKFHVLGGMIVFPSLTRIAAVLGAMIGSCVFSLVDFGIGDSNLILFAALGWAYLNWCQFCSFEYFAPWRLTWLHGVIAGTMFALEVILFIGIARFADGDNNLWPLLVLGATVFCYGVVVTMLSDLLPQGLRLACPYVWQLRCSLGKRL